MIANDTVANNFKAVFKKCVGSVLRQQDFDWIVSGSLSFPKLHI